MIAPSIALARVPTTMWGVAVALLVLSRTGSLSLAGVTVAAGSLPAALTGPLLGGWLDVTRSRRRPGVYTLMDISMTILLWRASSGR